jgi:glycosyltransferase involved in cell wall biosynthesis
MRIGIMLRSINEMGGVGNYTRNITKELLALDRENEYVLFYQNPTNLGRFSNYKNVSEQVVRFPGKAVWDQIGIPLACFREKVDVIFHPKFTVPLFATCKSVMVLHGAGWFMPEFKHFWKKTDLILARVTMPLYCNRASAVLSVSQITTDTFNRIFHLPTDKVTTVYLAPGRNFTKITDRTHLDQVRSKYNLPERFIFTLSGYDRGDRKNISGIFKAFEMCYGKMQHKLVIGGRDCYKFKQDYGIPDEGYGRDIYFTGWIAQEDLPAIFSLADVFLYPSNVEAFPMPITEAFACGTPVITSDANGLREIAGDAALFVNPHSTQEIGAAILEIIENSYIKTSLSEKGLARSNMYKWDTCAQKTLTILTSVV